MLVEFFMKKIWSSPLMVIGSLVVFGLALTLLYRNVKGEKNVLFNKNNKSSLKLELSNQRPLVQQPVTVTVSVDTQGSSINATGIYLRFDPQKLQMLNMDTRASFCQYYPEKKFDNALGTVSLACGSPHPGINGENTLMTLEFLPLATGNTKISTDARSQIMKSDGKGTNILTDYPYLEIPVYSGL